LGALAENGIAFYTVNAALESAAVESGACERTVPEISRQANRANIDTRRMFIT